jgi:hypothetical protein
MTPRTWSDRTAPSRRFRRLHWTGEEKCWGRSLASPTRRSVVGSNARLPRRCIRHNEVSSRPELRGPDLHNVGEAFAQCVIRACFTGGKPPQDQAELAGSRSKSAFPAPSSPRRCAIRVVQVVTTERRAVLRPGPDAVVPPLPASGIPSPTGAGERKTIFSFDLPGSWPTMLKRG